MKPTMKVIQQYAGMLRISLTDARKLLEGLDNPEAALASEQKRRVDLYPELRRAVCVLLGDDEESDYMTTVEREHFARAILAKCKGE